MPLADTAVTRHAARQLQGLLQAHRLGAVEIRVDDPGCVESTGLLVSPGQLVVLAAGRLPTLDHQSLVIAVPRRLEPQPVLVYAAQHADRLASQLRDKPDTYDPRDLFAGLPEGARVAVPGPGEASLACWLRPDMEVELFETPAQDVFVRLQESLVDAMIADACELDPKLLSACPHRLLREPWLSEVGQGASIVVASREDESLTVLLKSVEHRSSRIEVECEVRLQTLCRVTSPHALRARARSEGDRLSLRAALILRDSRWAVQAKRQGEFTRSGAGRLARQVARDLSDQVAQSSLLRG